MPKKRRDLRATVRRPKVEDVLWLIERLYLCEWGCEDHVLKGRDMSRAYMFTHIVIGKCKNPHNDYRSLFWKIFRLEKARDRAFESGDMEKFKALLAERE